ncbi:MAG: TerC family protein [Armatimonadetes bacterium]|nr:TerC family protein [Armatimonadota bacterium]
MVISGIGIGIWGAFLIFVLLMLALDLGVFHKESHEVKMKEALGWSAVWIALALAFNAGLFFFWNAIQPNSPYTPAEAGQAFLAGYLVEKALSVDNIFVFLVVFSYFQVPPKYQHRVLFFGIVGALLFRAAFIAAGSSLLTQFHWMLLVFGAILIATGIKMVAVKDKKIDPDKNPVIRGVKKLIPVTPDFVGQNFFTRINGKLWATPLLITLIFVEITDVIFAVDSIPAIFAITKDPFIVFTSNVFAILGLRALFFALSGLMGLFHYLSYGLATILVFVGGKMTLSYWEIKIPIVISLLVIVGILALSILASKLWPPRTAHSTPQEA